MSTAQLGRFEDVEVGVRLKIASLWIAMLFLFAYGDIFGFFAPGRIEEIQGGRISGMEITQAFLLAVAVYIAIASAMVFLTLVLRPAANRWVNILVAALYIVSIVASMFGEDAYFVFLSLAEIAMLGLIVWYAWTWPERSPADGS
jgi:cell division protein FtsB